MDEGHVVYFVYLNFAKAFDSANLKSSCTDGPVRTWIKSYLSDLSYQVQIDGLRSEEAPYPIGANQGPVIGPLPF